MDEERFVDRAGASMAGAVAVAVVEGKLETFVALEVVAGSGLCQVGCLPTFR